MQPLGFERDLAFYALKNQLTGKRSVRLEKVTPEGDFYCNAGEPNKEEVQRYYKDLRSGTERLNTFKGLEDLLCECRGLADYLNQTENCPKLVLLSAFKDPFFDIKRDLYIVSPVSLVRGKWKARLVDRCAAGEIYRISPRAGADFPQMRGTLGGGLL